MSSKPRTPITFYPKPALEAAIKALAVEDERSVANLMVKWCLERPEVQERLNGGTAK